MNDSSLFSNEPQKIESRPPLGEDLLPPVEQPSARFIIQLFVVPALIASLLDLLQKSGDVPLAQQFDGLLGVLGLGGGQREQAGGQGQVLFHAHPADFGRHRAGSAVAAGGASNPTRIRSSTTMPDERIEVIETPEYLREVLPFAAYFSPAPFDPDPKPPVTTLSSKVTTRRFPRAWSRISWRSSGFAKRALMTPIDQPIAGLPEVAAQRQGPERRRRRRVDETRGRSAQRHGGGPRQER